MAGSTNMDRDFVVAGMIVDRMAVEEGSKNLKKLAPDSRRWVLAHRSR